MSLNKEPLKVIHMTPLGAGGLSKLTVTIHENLDRQKIRFDYLCFRNEKEFFEDKILALGGRKQVIDTTNMHNKFGRTFKKTILMKKLFQKEKYDIAHVDASTPFDVFVALAAKMAGVKIIILHSHNDGMLKNDFLRDMFIRVYKRLMLITVTDYITISESAAKFMFPKKILKSGNYQLIRNGIPTKKFLFSQTGREKIRIHLNIENRFVVGHIGRFVYQKNHKFIVETFYKLHMEHPEAFLILVGVGELLEEIKLKVEKMGLSDSVCFYGTTYDINEVLSAMDIFMFPSHFEGLGIVAIEAQCTGLPICCADTIVEEAKVSELFYRVNGWDENIWVKSLWEHGHSNLERRSYEEEVVNAGYDIGSVAKYMENWYIDKVKEQKDV